MEPDSCQGERGRLRIGDKYKYLRILEGDYDGSYAIDDLPVHEMRRSENIKASHHHFGAFLISTTRAV
jgi:hypothetical protein